MKMKKWLFISLVSVAMIGAGSFSIVAADSAPGAADQGAGMESPATGDQGGMSPGGEQMSSVEVTEVNKDQGTIQIKKQEGGQETIKLDESAKAQLDQIQKGDKVDLQVVDRNGEKFATSLSKSG